MRYLILNLLDGVDVAHIGGLAGLLELDFGHVEAEVGLYDIGFDVLHEHCLVFVVALGLHCQVLRQLVLE